MIEPSILITEAICVLRLSCPSSESYGKRAVTRAAPTSRVPILQEQPPLTASKRLRLISLVLTCFELPHTAFIVKMCDATNLSQYAGRDTVSLTLSTQTHYQLPNSQASTISSDLVLTKLSVALNKSLYGLTTISNSSYSSVLTSSMQMNYALAKFNSLMSTLIGARQPYYGLSAGARRQISRLFFATGQIFLCLRVRKPFVKRLNQAVWYVGNPSHLIPSRQGRGLRVSHMA